MWVTDATDDKIYAYEARHLVNSNSHNSLSTRVAAIGAAPDLIVPTLSASTNTLAPSNAITLTATVGNRGAGASTAATLRWYRSTDTTIDPTDTEIRTSLLTPLASGASNAYSISTNSPQHPRHLLLLRLRR